TRIIEQMTTELLDAASAVQSVVVSKAMDGDMAAASLLLSRVMPSVKPRSMPVQFEFDRNASVEENGAAILEAVSQGKIDPETAKGLLECLSAYVGLRDINVLLEELRKLYHKKGSELPGGVKLVPMNELETKE